MTDSARESLDRAQMVGVPQAGAVIVIIAIIVLVADVLLAAPDYNEMEGVVHVCNGVFGCNGIQAHEAIAFGAPPVAAVVISLIQRVRHHYRDE